MAISSGSGLSKTGKRTSSSGKTMIRRLFRIVQSNIDYAIHKSQQSPSGKANTYEHTHDQNSDTSSTAGHAQARSKSQQQLIDDLALFGLTPPATLKAVTAARNREMLKFHPDKFATNQDKSAVANEIALLYNAAFDRLKVYYR